MKLSDFKPGMLIDVYSRPKQGAERIVAASMPVTLRVGRRTYQCADLSHASLVYQIARDESDDGSRRWPDGVATLSGKAYRISYNGRVWDGDVAIIEAA